MIGNYSGQVESKEVFYGCIEAFSREKIREWMQDLLEQEVTELLGREKSERKASVIEQPGYRNGYGRARRFTLSLGTVEVRRPRVRNAGERFVSRVLPLFKRQTREVRDLLPELYLQGKGRRFRSVKVRDFPFGSMEAVLCAIAVSVCGLGYRLSRETPEVQDKSSQPEHGREHPCKYCSVSTKGRNQDITCNKGNT